MSSNLDIAAIKQDFPIFRQEENLDLVYLDSAATTQKPEAVLQASNRFYETINANAHRGAYKISEQATEAYENSRKKVAQFIGAPDPQQVIFVRSTTEALNFVAIGWGNKFVGSGDEIIVTEMEHHSNLIPWQMLAQRTGATLRILHFDDCGQLNLEELDRLLSEKTKLVAIVHVSNALGTVNPVKEIVGKAHAVGAKVVVDGAQSTPHMPIKVTDFNADFYAFSGHKMLAPMGIGVLYGKAELLNEMDPVYFGGEMISDVDYYQSTWNDIPWKFEAGTQNVAGAVGLAAAIDYINSIGIERIHLHDQRLTAYALNELQKIEGIRIFGPLGERGATVSFEIDNVHAHDLATFLDQKRIAIRSGHHCAKLVMKKFKVAATARASFYLYNSEEDIDRLIDAIRDAKDYFSKWL